MKRSSTTTTVLGKEKQESDIGLVKRGRKPSTTRSVSSGTSSKRQTSKSSEASPVYLGERLRAIRTKLGLTLATAAQMTAVGTSTLSKIENGQVSPTYDVLQKIVQGLSIDLVDLFDTRQHVLPQGRRTVTRAGAGGLHVTPRYQYEALATELTHKKFFPLRATITARISDMSQSDAPDITSHPGEEFVYVLSGAIELHLDYYAPCRLEAGDSIYFDSTMRHALFSVSEQDAEILWVASQA